MAWRCAPSPYSALASAASLSTKFQATAHGHRHAHRELVCGRDLLEDDYDSDFHQDPGVIPLHTLDHEQSVVYVGSFSKSLSPVLRLGFIVAPPSLQPAIHIAKQLMDWHSNLPLQGALAEFLDSGGFARHVRRMRGIYARRSKALIRALKERLYNKIDVLPRALGLHVCVLARPTWGPIVETAARESAASGVRAQVLSDFSQQPDPPLGLILGYGMLDEAKIKEGVRRLAAHLPTRIRSQD